MTLSTRVISAGDLSHEELALWSRLQRADSALESPYFRPEFTEDVAAVRDDVSVAVLERNGEPAGFLPFQRRHSGIGGPVGGALSDFHGAIVPPDLKWDAATVVRQCGLRVWNFDHLIASQAEFHPFRFGQSKSAYIELSQGFEAYRQERRAAGSNRIKQMLRKGRKLARDVGPLRFVPHSRDPQVLKTLLRWKSAQYRRSRLNDLFSFAWTKNLLRRILDRKQVAFRGRLAVLYAGKRIVAVDLGIQSHGVWHSWFPSYDRELAKYCPGHVLSVELFRAAEELGIQRVHWGKGDEDYKQSFASGYVMVADGSVDLNPLRKLAKQSWYRLRERMRRSPLKRVLQRPVRMIRRVFNQAGLY